ncbi:MAG: DUF6597 domain-containing transcriptional factor [Vicinamibacterales bacterium]
MNDFLAKRPNESTETGPRLAIVAGLYRERLPTPTLNGHVSRVWINELAQPSELQIIPDGCMDIIWTGERLQVAGPDTHAVIERMPGATLVGIRFAPGAAPLWLRASAATLVNSRVPLEHFWGGAATDRLADRLSAEQSPSAVARILEHALVERLPNVDAPDSLVSAVVRAVTRAATNGTAVVRRLVDELGGSERTLRRRCDEAFGYGPKMLARILRFQKFLRLVHHSDQPWLSMLAIEAGYADQAHLTRESRRLVGFTPRRVVSELRS